MTDPYAPPGAVQQPVTGAAPYAPQPVPSGWAQSGYGAPQGQAEYPPAGQRYTGYLRDVPYDGPASAIATAAARGGRLGATSLTLAVAGLVTGLSVLLGVPAIIVGRRALRNIRNGGQDNESLARAGVIVGFVAVAFTAVVVFMVVVLASGADWNTVVPVPTGQPKEYT